MRWENTPIFFARPSADAARGIAHRTRTRPSTRHVECDRLRLECPPAEAIEQKVAKRVRGGNVILLHDGGHKQIGADRSQTVIATDH